ncbi:PREDICTED: protein misato homolog 1-like [Priapulus caudatus]|uniref:Protein misato homolog 1-like n=1 Tax=Priapulus caudatus TaxID=37621 RepID=A0ABM1E297_PRICU|nr:PREDICTED: protein misato homolog 1-like [Priapulus caudatus]
MEIITLQVGHYANFIGTHWYNLQEASFLYEPNPEKQREKILNHDVLFREGVTLTGQQTYTPRLIAFDLKGSLNTLRQEGVLYDVPSRDEIQWGGDVTLHQSTQSTKNRFLEELDKIDTDYLEHTGVKKFRIEKQDEKEEDMDVDSIHEGEDNVDRGQVLGPSLYNLDSCVKVWSDYMRVHLHPKSVYTLQQYDYNSDMQRFDIFGLGQQVYQEKKTHDDIEDRLHFFAEECDNLHGFQILVDYYNGFGGLGSEMTEMIQDEYSKCVLSFPVSPTTFDTPRTIYYDTCRTVNSILSLVKLASHSSLTVPLSLMSDLVKPTAAPLSLPHINYKAELPYHSSAVLAAALDTVSLLYRVDKDPVPIGQICDTLNARGRKLAALGIALPFPMRDNASLLKTLTGLGRNLPWTMLTPQCTSSHGPAQMTTLRGVPPQDGGTGSAMLRSYLEDVCPRQLSGGMVVSEPCKVSSPFPHIFRPDISCAGLLSDRERPMMQGVSSVPAMSCLSSASDISNMLSSLHGAAKRYNIHKFHKFVEAGLDVDDFKETMDCLETLITCYDDN